MTRPLPPAAPLGPGEAGAAPSPAPSPDDPRFRARLYARTHPGNPGDVAFYQRACRGAGEVLELGCGTGRVARALARNGLRVTGVDRSPGHLAEARASLDGAAARRVTLVEADLRELDLGRRFPRVIAPYNLLCGLGGEEGLRAGLAAAERHLEDGGAFLFDLYAVDEADVHAPPEAGLDAWEPLDTWLQEGYRVEVFEAELPGPTPRLLDMAYAYRLTPLGGGEAAVVEDVISHLLLPATALEAHLAAAGLTLREAWGGFRREPRTPDADRVVGRATRAAPGQRRRGSFGA